MALTGFHNIFLGISALTGKWIMQQKKKACVPFFCILNTLAQLFINVQYLSFDILPQKPSVYHWEKEREMAEGVLE